MPYLVPTPDDRPQERTDRELLEAICAGDEPSLSELIARKTNPLLRVAQRIVGDLEDARDVVQMTFVRVWEQRDRFDPRWSPNTWIYRIATNLAIDHVRSRKSKERHREPVRQHLRRVADVGSSRPLAELRHKEVDSIFQRLADHLSEKQRLAFQLREIEGFSSAEAAQVMGCRESTVRNHLFTARRTLRRELGRVFPEYTPRSEERA